MCVNLRRCIFPPWQPPERVLWWYEVSNEDQQQQSLFIIHSLTKAKPRFIDVQHMCVHLRLCIFHPWQLPKRVLLWYTVSNGDQQHKFNFHIPYFKHGQTTFHRCVHETTSLVIQTLTITKRRFINLHKSESLRLPMEVTHVKQINTISKSPTVVIHPWHYPRHALFILTILSKG